MGIMKNGTFTDVHICPLDTFQQISPCHKFGSDQHLTIIVLFYLIKSMTSGHQKDEIFYYLKQY